MDGSQTKVVPIRQGDTQVQRNTMSVDKRSVINVSAGLLKNHLQKSLATHLDDVELRMLDNVNSKEMNAVAVDVKVFQKTSQERSSVYIDSVIKNLSDFVSEVNPSADKVNKLSEDMCKWPDLELLAMGEVEKQLLVDGYISEFENKLSRVLYALQRRVEFISKRKDLKGSESPFSPAILINTYMELLKCEMFSTVAYKLFCESFCEAVLPGLGKVLDEINEQFIQANILPTLPKPKVKISDGVSKKEATSFVNEKVAQLLSGGAEALTPTQMHLLAGAAGYVDQAHMMQIADIIDPGLYNGLVKMAQTYRSKVGEKNVSDGLVVTGQPLPTTELIDTLTTLQKEAAVDGVDINESVRLQIGSRVQVNGERQPYAEQDETLIDVVAMFFDVILQDRHLPDTVRAMIAQLQIPILKVAMMDKDFFAKKSHPARKFLNVLSQAGLGVSNENRQIKSAVFEKMEELVARVLMDFDNDIEIFAELFEEFDIFMEQQQRQMDVIEERSRKVTKSTEQLELTKRQAAYEIALRLNGKSIPEFVQLFLDDAWKDVLVLALLRREREPTETQECIDVIERLIVSVVEPADGKARAEILEGLARLLKDIRVGLENISYDFHESAPFFKELESWHKRILTTETNNQDDIPVANEVVLVDFDEELCASLEEDLLLELESEMAQMPDDKFSKKANKMEVGDWVEYKSAEGATLRAKLSWKSAVTMQCLFVNDRGAKAMDISMADFAEELRQQRMSLVGQEKAPLVERVLEGMKKMMMPSNEEPSLA
jgi:hypothetical protein